MRRLEEIKKTQTGALEARYEKLDKRLDSTKNRDEMADIAAEKAIIKMELGRRNGHDKNFR